MNQNLDSRGSLPVKSPMNRRLPPIIAVMIVACQCLAANGYTNAANKSVTPRAATKTSASEAPANTSTKSYKVPEWWRREWERRGRVRWFESKQLAQEVKINSKVMWNPRSPQAMAYRRAWLLSHPKRQSQSVVLPRSATVSQHQAKPSGTAGVPRKQ